MVKPSGKTPKILTQRELLARFLDTDDWRVAHKQFPSAPWRYYCAPQGQYSKLGWTFFKKAYKTAWTCANLPRTSFEDRVLKNRLTLNFLVELNSLMLFGESRPLARVIRQYSPACRQLVVAPVKNLFEKSGNGYRNPDGLKIEVEGFLPADIATLVNTYYFEKISLATDSTERKRWAMKLKKKLKKQIGIHEKRNMVYFLLSPSKIKSQLDAILKFYNRECLRILKEVPPNSKKFYLSVATLALKMQRYIDMTHLAMDGTSRTSRLVEEFVYWQFGFNSPDPVPISYFGKKWHRSAYLPLNKALAKVKPNR